MLMTKIPLYLKTDNELPRFTDAEFYLLARNGLFFCRNHRFFQSDVLCSRGPGWLVEHDEQSQLNFPKIKKTMLERIVGFFFANLPDPWFGSRRSSLLESKGAPIPHPGTRSGGDGVGVRWRTPLSAGCALHRSPGPSGGSFTGWGRPLPRNRGGFRFFHRSRRRVLQTWFSCGRGPNPGGAAQVPSRVHGRWEADPRTFRRPL